MARDTKDAVQATPIAERQAAQTESIFAANQNPAGKLSKDEFRKRRKPYSGAGGLKFEVPPNACPGYHLHGFSERNVQRAKEHGYELVTREELYFDGHAPIGAGADAEANTDLGNNVSIVGNPSTGERCVLMKLPMEYWLDDERARMEAELKTARHIFGSALENPGPEQAAQFGSDTKLYAPIAPSLSRGKGGPPIINGPIMNRGLPKLRTIQKGP